MLNLVTNRFDESSAGRYTLKIIDCDNSVFALHKLITKPWVKKMASTLVTE
jgi:hypothetical protein